MEPKDLEMKFITCSLLLLLISEGAISFRVPSATRYYGADLWRRSDSLSVTKSSYSADIPYEILPMQTAIDKLTHTTNNSDHLKNGLSDEEAAQLLAQVGPNALQPPKKTSIWELWLQQFDGECPNSMK